MKIFIFLTIFTSTSAIVFDCEYKGDPYTCVVNAYKEHTNPILTAINGNHEVNKTEKDVRGIYFNLHGKNLKKFPKKIERFFPNITLILIKGGNVSKLNGDEFRGFKNLENFNFENTQLEYVPGNLFSSNKKLKKIFFNDNQIKYVGAELFDGLDKLVYIGFERNICVDDITSDPEKIEKIKRKIRENCTVPDYLTSRASRITFKSVTWNFLIFIFSSLLYSTYQNF
jgi:hypothetical protein